MTTKIGLVSDVHSSPVPLAQAISIFERENVEHIICAGDIAGYFDTLGPTIELLRQNDCKCIIGNHDQKFVNECPEDEFPQERAFLRELPQTLELAFDGTTILVVHANPPSEQHGGIKLLDQQGEIIPERIQEWRETLAGFEQDVLIVGHTHQVYAEQLGDVFVVNPGSPVFNHSCMVLSLPDLNVQTFALDNKDIVKCWNFSMLFA